MNYLEHLEQEGGSIFTFDAVVTAEAEMIDKGYGILVCYVCSCDFIRDTPNSKATIFVRAYEIEEGVDPKRKKDMLRYICKTCCNRHNLFQNELEEFRIMGKGF